MVEKLQKELDALKQDCDSPLKRFQEFQENEPDEDELVPDCDLPLNLWTKNQLISGIEESIRDMQGLEDQKEALIRELERMKKTLQKNGLSSSIEMNQEMKNLLGEVLKCVSCHNIKMVWKDKPARFDGKVLSANPRRLPHLWDGGGKTWKTRPVPRGND